MLTLKQEIPARIRIRGQMDEAGEMDLVVQVSAPYGVPVDGKSGEHTASARVEGKVPPELRDSLKGALEAIRAHTEKTCAEAIQRALIIARDTGLRLGEIKEG